MALLSQPVPLDFVPLPPVTMMPPVRAAQQQQLPPTFRPKPSPASTMQTIPHSFSKPPPPLPKAVIKYVVGDSQQPSSLQQ